MAAVAGASRTLRQDQRLAQVAALVDILHLPLKDRGRKSISCSS